MTKRDFIEKWQPGYLDTFGTHKSDEWMRDFISLFEDDKDTEKTVPDMSWSRCKRKDLKLIGTDIVGEFYVVFDRDDARNKRTTPDRPPKWPVKFVLGNMYFLYSQNDGLWRVFCDGYTSLTPIALFRDVNDAVSFIESRYES